jgi:2-polyprenyl-3-methyl-5-hydroxy-6-metoxy-1,4-benzoquinol methylase
VSYATIDDLRSQLGKAPAAPSSQAYASKMLHRVPKADVVDREQFILEHCKGRRVLEFGASGPMHEAIVTVAERSIGVDREDGSGVIGFDLDDVAMQTLPSPTDWTPNVIVCGEVLEHLSNPGWFLTRLRRQFGDTTTIITVPNAFSTIGQKRLSEGIENVNIDHVAWYSFRTLKTLLGRAGYSDFSFAWYRGAPLTAEGLVVLCGKR